MNLLLASAEAGGKFQQLQTQFGIEGKYLLMQVISFTILAVVLYRFFFKPVLATVEERNAKIADGLRHAEEMQAKLAAAQQESAALLKAAQLDGQKIVDEARRTAKEYADKQQAEALARAADLVEKARQAIDLEHKKMLDQARGEIARLVVTTTERVLAKKLSDADRAAYNETASKELTVI